MIKHLYRHNDGYLETIIKDDLKYICFRQSLIFSEKLTFHNCFVVNGLLYNSELWTHNKTKESNIWNLDIELI